VKGVMGAYLRLKVISRAMLIKRLLVTIVLLPIGLAVIALGGVAYSGLITLIMALAAWEYIQLFRAGGLKPAGILVVAGAALLVIGRAWNGFESASWLISLLILASMTYHLGSYERGRNPSGTDFGVTLAGILYIGWLGAYLVSLRNLPDGEWWVLLALPSVWMTDTGAFVIGSTLGRHQLNRRLSPKKTWEGYIGGVFCGTLAGALLALAIQSGAGPIPAITPLNGAILGFVIGVTTLLGDLGESMIKRQVGAKDSGKMLPGHGGIFDRIDSWLWAGVISYYIIYWFF
jgi:phosphatidate cytidylyltransferase